MCKWDYIIEKLCHDRFFGILTRNGLEYKMDDIEDDDCHIILMDFCDISLLNGKYGYSQVNQKFTELFADFKDDHIIGRCFSGDEIVVITRDISVIDDLKKKSRQLGLDFRHITCKYTNLESDLEHLTSQLDLPDGK